MCGIQALQWKKPWASKIFHLPTADHGPHPEARKMERNVQTLGQMVWDCSSILVIGPQSTSDYPCVVPLCLDALVYPVQ